MNDKFTPARLGDYTFNCQICGSKEWASKATRLDTYTGRGGLMVCPDCNDPIDYGLVPYKVPAEKPVPWSVDAMNTADPQNIYQKYSPLNYLTDDPLSGSPPEEED